MTTSSSTIPFVIVDVFSRTPYKGNPLAIVDATSHPDLATTQMQLLARQFNLSETTFFFPPSSPGNKASYKLRSFLPDGREVFGVGHNILGVWWYLAHVGLLDFHSAVKDGDGWCLKQELGGTIGDVKITHRGGRFQVAIRQAPPLSHGFHPDAAALANSLGIAAEEIGFANGDGGRRLTPQIMSTSTTHHLLIPVASVDALNRVNMRRDKILKQLALVDERVYGAYVFTPMSGANGVPAFQARFFSPGMSGEDPATGSAAGPLSAYMYRHGGLNVDSEGKAKILVRQGLKVGRECVIEVVLSVNAEGRENKRLEVDIVGGGVTVSEGKTLIPNADLIF
ncbi:phenazine biosynthesis protein [Coniochaeta sp. 2T2.1]|nr:phenazine biosynthesis protein [Coniochaeta sp. 2T2.1]